MKSDLATLLMLRFSFSLVLIFCEFISNETLLLNMDLLLCYLEVLHTKISFLIIWELIYF